MVWRGTLETKLQWHVSQFELELGNQRSLLMVGFHFLRGQTKQRAAHAQGIAPKPKKSPKRNSKA